MKISKALANHAVDELLQMGYTVNGDALTPPEKLSDFACKFFGLTQPQPPRSGTAPLSDEQIKAVVHAAVKSGRLSWAGYEKDEVGEYTVPVLSLSHYQLARVIEAALAGHPTTPTPKDLA